MSEDYEVERGERRERERELSLANHLKKRRGKFCYPVGRRRTLADISAWTGGDLGGDFCSSSMMATTGPQATYLLVNFF
jgi:hypothetical protein